MTTNTDVLPLTTLSNLVYYFTSVCERRYIGKTTQRLSARIKQHVLLTLINAGLALRCAGRGGGVVSFPAEEQVGLARQLADSRQDSAITRHLMSNHDCLIAVCSHVLISVVAQARNHFHLDVLEAVYIKLQSCFVPTKGICENIAFGVNITPLSHVPHISNVFTFFCYSYFASRSVLLTGCIAIFLRHNLPIYIFLLLLSFFILSAVIHLMS